MSESKEKLELVTDFSSLRAGMIVVYRKCGFCGRSHRGILMSPATIGRLCGSAEFPLEPPPACAPRGLVLCECAVVNRHLYRVVDGLDPEADRIAADQGNNVNRKALVR